MVRSDDGAFISFGKNEDEEEVAVFRFNALSQGTVVGFYGSATGDDLNTIGFIYVPTSCDPLL